MRPFGRVRQFVSALGARQASAEEEVLLGQYLSPPQLALFLRMRPNDQRHSLRVFRRLLAAGETDPYLLQAALLHDAGKSLAPLWLVARVATVLLAMIDRGIIHRLASGQGEGWRKVLYVQAHHPQLGAELARAAGCETSVVELIRQHEQRSSSRLALILRKADEEG